ncbi:tRNA (N6-isopentenyl adenosine(37)-C2)-methylthiotransferase MiaB [Patescibacteria group bacterium]
MGKIKTYNIITIGCQMNKSDSERVAGYLEIHGLKPTKNKAKAGLMVVNTCGVRQSAEDRIFGLIPKIKKDNPKAKIILTGCLSERVDIKRRAKGVDIWLPIIELPKLHEKLNLESQIRIRDYLKINAKHNSKVSAFVPIGNGCNNFCAYCVVPYARGREVYRPTKDILKEVQELVKHGYKEINLIAQNVNSYKEKFPISNFQFLNNSKILNSKFKTINFAQLLELVNAIEGRFWIRFATSHPKDMSDELIKSVKELDKVCEHIHLPVQAGDNEVLKNMNRKYSLEHYKNLIKKIHNEIPGVALSTDVIVGFPGETKAQYENTKKLFKEIKFDLAYIAQYSPRPGTAAYKLKDDVPKSEKKRREEELMKILRKTALENNKNYVGKVAEVLIEGKNKKGEWFGKTRSYKVVKIKNQKSKIKIKEGDFIKVKITSAKDFGLDGEAKITIRNKKIIVILGPTSSGKTSLAVKLALKYNGEIVSADSRQVYKGMDVGTGKDLDEYKVQSKKSKVKKVPYHLIDVVSPRTEFNLAKYQKLANKAIEDILNRGKLPIIVGGTGLYLEALVDGYQLSVGKPDKKLRQELEKLSKDELFKKLAKLDTGYANSLNNSDRNNKRRLIRYLEIRSSKEAKLPIGSLASRDFDFLILGLDIPRIELNDRINKRLIHRLDKQGMVEEVRDLQNQGVSWKRLESFGLEYRFVSQYLQNKFKYDEMVERLNIAIRQFAKRQMTWFRRWERKRKIHWVQDYSESIRHINKFLK